MPTCDRPHLGRGHFLGNKIKLSGRSSGKLCSRGPIWGSRALACARVLADQALYLWLRNLPVIHGKEKVYGSIP
jgi:hypothetical protein